MCLTCRLHYLVTYRIGFLKLNFRLMADRIHEFRTKNGVRFLNIWWHPAPQVVAWKWYGLVEPEDLMRGFSTAIKELFARKARGGLADMTEMEGGWPADATDWLVSISDAMMAADMRMAVVDRVQQDLINEIALQQLMIRRPGFVHIFHSTEEAFFWLSQS